MLDFIWYLAGFIGPSATALWNGAAHQIALADAWITSSYLFTHYVIPFFRLAAQYWAVPLLAALIFHRILIQGLLYLAVAAGVVALLPLAAVLALPAAVVYFGCRAFLYVAERLTEAVRPSDKPVPKPVEFRFDSRLYGIPGVPSGLPVTAASTLPENGFASWSLQRAPAVPEEFGADAGGFEQRVRKLIADCGVPVLRDIYLQGRDRVVRVALLAAVGENLAVIEILDLSGVVRRAEIGEKWIIVSPDGTAAEASNPVTRNWVAGKVIKECFPGIKVTELVVITEGLRFVTEKPPEVYEVEEALSYLRDNSDPYMPFMGRVKRVFDAIKASDKTALKAKYRLENTDSPS